MTLQIELRRVGVSRSSLATVPIQACVIQSGKPGGDLIPGQGLKDVANVKKIVQAKVDAMFRCAVEIEWVDRTEE